MKLMSIFTLVIAVVSANVVSVSAATSAKDISQAKLSQNYVKSLSEYNDFLIEVKDFNTYMRSQREYKGDYSEEEFQIKCANNYCKNKLKKSSNSYSIDAVDPITDTRIQMESAALLMGTTLPSDSFILQHSLQNNPSDVYLPEDDRIVYEIRATNAYQDKIQYFKKHNKYKSKNLYFESSDSIDLYLALHATKIKSTVVSGVGYNIISHITDTYDFEFKNFTSKNVGKAAYTIINNYGAYAQAIGAINTYDIDITVTDFK